MLDRRWRGGVERTLGPLGQGLRRLGISADALTVFGLLVSVAAALLIGSGHHGWAVVAIIVAGVSDLLDGAIARGSGQASPRGAFFDSVTDRASDALLLGGCAYWLAGEDPHLSVLAFAVGALSMIISYERARAEAIGINARGGLMERAERFVFLSVGLAFGILVPILWIMLVLTAYTALTRFWKVYQQADKPQPVHTRRTRRPTPADGESRVALRDWWAARRVDSRTTRRTHRSPRRSARP